MIFSMGIPGDFRYHWRMLPVFSTVLRKTVPLKRNLMRPWLQPMIIMQTGRALWRAWRNAEAHPYPD